jgi:hypothetical protein
VGECKKVAPTRKKGKRDVSNELALLPYEVPLFICLGAVPERCQKHIENVFCRVAVLYADIDVKELKATLAGIGRGVKGGVLNKSGGWASDTAFRECKMITDEWHQSVLEAKTAYDELIAFLKTECWTDLHSGERISLDDLDGYLERGLKELFPYPVEYLRQGPAQMTLFVPENPSEDACVMELANYVKGTIACDNFRFSVHDLVVRAFCLGLNDNAQSVNIFQQAVRRSGVLEGDVEVSDGMLYMTPTRYGGDFFGRYYRLRVKNARRLPDTYVFRRNKRLLAKIKRIFAIEDQSVDTVGYACLTAIFICKEQKILLFMVDDSLQENIFFHSSDGGIRDYDWCAVFEEYLTDERTETFRARVLNVRGNRGLSEIIEFLYYGYEYDSKGHWFWVCDRKHFETEIFSWVERERKERHMRFVAEHATKLLPAGLSAQKIA